MDGVGRDPLRMGGGADGGKSRTIVSAELGLYVEPRVEEIMNRCYGREQSWFE